jgi:hypothetical protein
MKIIDRLPFADRPHLVTVRGEAVDVYRNQIISVFEDEDAPRLPLVGLRTIIANKLTLVIDGNHREVTLKTSGWRW